MFKPSVLCKLAICRRLVVIVAIWSAFLIGANEVRRAAQGDSVVYEDVKRLAVYSLALRLNR
ncbi:hypothetical protein PN498_20030 [Oscillatoria sp. CS-180]|uniref:hypothetical protein n=1 Tax=Oscillatoria sp. CS-180 TaxID=3021720 RepID=UPI00232E8FBE|nr:hypothetical protein [Oscillatoria sp. CS-180]MDB9528292.1 hypothetical protein [Oscillatoria sp. CS-180]